MLIVVNHFHTCACATNGDAPIMIIEITPNFKWIMFTKIAIPMIGQWILRKGIDGLEYKLASISWYFCEQCFSFFPGPSTHSICDTHRYSCLTIHFNQSHVLEVIGGIPVNPRRTRSFSVSELEIMPNLKYVKDNTELEIFHLRPN